MVWFEHKAILYSYIEPSTRKENCIFSVKSFRVFLSDVGQVSASELVVLETDGRKTLLYFHFVCLLYFDFARSSERVK